MTQAVENFMYYLSIIDYMSSLTYLTDELALFSKSIVVIHLRNCSRTIGENVTLMLILRLLIKIKVIFSVLIFTKP